MKIPFTTFIGYLRRITPDEQEQLAATALAVAFPQFATLNELMETEKQYSKPKRRFAGDNTFPRGRYYTIAQEPDGNDFGTLCNELIAYADKDITGEFEIEDLTFPSKFTNILDEEFKSSFMESFAAKSGLGFHPYVILFFNRYDKNTPKQPLSILSRIIHNQIEKKGIYQDHILGVLRQLSCDLPNEKKLDIEGTFVYYTTSHEIIENTIDLRTITGQEWLASLMESGELGFKVSISKYRFLSILPYLISNEKGGNLITDNIGLYLRKNGVNALIYPSARSDCFLRIRNGITEDSRHWNLIDYRGTLDANLPIPNISNISCKLAPAIRIEHPDCFELAGSFRIMGNTIHT